MSKIYGDKDTIKRAQAAKPGDKTVYINWDAIKELPDQYEVKIVDVKFTEDDFTNVGSKKAPSWYPTTSLMYSIAEARGVSGALNSITETVYEEIDISEMYMDGKHQIMRKKVGYIVKKASCVLNEDGTERHSSVRHGVFNAWEECTALWHKEEKATEGYNPKLLKSYPSGDKYYEYTWEGKVKKKALKYDTKWKRVSHFDELMDVAFGQADTKAHLKTIRELAGLPTGFTTEDLKPGIFTFAKITRSREALQLDQAAHLSSIEKGGRAEPNKMLFGPSEGSIEVVEETEPEKTEEPEKESDREKLIKALDFYLTEKDIDLTDENRESATKTLQWIKDTEDAENHKFWSKALNNLRIIEEPLPEFTRFNHGLTLT